MAVTLAALAIVREQRGGSIELFRAAPISPFETLAGKSISYLVLTIVLAIILTALMVLGLKTPMLGNWAAYAAGPSHNGSCAGGFGRLWIDSVCFLLVVPAPEDG